MKMNAYGLIENPLNERELDDAIKSIMTEASKEKRAEEETATKELVKHYEEHIRYCDEYFRAYGENPGGWNGVFSHRDRIAEISISAVAMENRAMYLTQWLDGAWKSTSWVSNHLSVLEKEREDNKNYYNNRFDRWKAWEKNGGDPGRALEDKRMEYVSRRFQLIHAEETLLRRLEAFAVELRTSKHPNALADGECPEANEYLALLYRQQLEAMTVVSSS